MEDKAIVGIMIGTLNLLTFAFFLWMIYNSVAPKYVSPPHSELSFADSCKIAVLIYWACVVLWMGK